MVNVDWVLNVTWVNLIRIGSNGFWKTHTRKFNNDTYNNIMEIWSIKENMHTKDFSLSVSSIKEMTKLNFVSNTIFAAYYLFGEFIAMEFYEYEAESARMTSRLKPKQQTGALVLDVMKLFYDGTLPNSILLRKILFLEQQCFYWSARWHNGRFTLQLNREWKNSCLSNVKKR